MLYNANVGTNNTATSKTTTAAGVTLSMAGTTVTATGSFFASTDVGAIIKFGASGAGGNEYTITAYTSATQVTVGASGTDSGAATVWQVQQTNVFTWYAGDNGTFEADSITFDATGGGSGIPTLTFKRGFQFAAVASPVTFKELAFGYTNGSAANMWSRVVVPGSGDALSTGQIYEVEYSLVLRFPGGVTPTAVGDTSGGVWNTAGNYMLETCVSGAIQRLITNVLPTNTNLDPIGQAFIGVITANWTQQTVMINTAIAVTATYNDSSYTDAYVNGTYTVTRHGHFNIGSANTTIYGVALAGSAGGGVPAATVKFTTPQVKDSSHTIDFTHTLSWSRVLTN